MVILISMHEQSRVSQTVKRKKHYLVHKVLQRHILPNKIFQLYPEASFNQFQPTYTFFYILSFPLPLCHSTGSFFLLVTLHLLLSVHLLLPII